MPDNCNYPALEMSLQQAHPGAGRSLLDWLSMTLSRRWMYSHRASSMTMALFIEGMARKSKVSRLFTAGKRAARIRRSTMRLRYGLLVGAGVCESQQVPELPEPGLLN